MYECESAKIIGRLTPTPPTKKLQNKVLNLYPKQIYVNKKKKQE